MTDPLDRDDPLRVHLAELCELFSSLLPASRLGVAVYEPDGSIRSHVGLDGFPATMPKGVLAEGETGNLAVHVSVALAYGRILTEAKAPSPVFAVCSAAALPAHTLASLCRMGAGLLRRTLDLMEQARLLRQIVREHEAIIDHISDGLIVIDRLGMLRYLNAPGARILGVSPTASIGRLLKDVIDFEPYITAILKTREGYVDRELQLRSSKVNVHIVDTAVPILGDDGEVVSIVNTFYEMSRAKKLSNRFAGDRARYHFSDIVGTSRKLRDAKAVAQRAAKSSASVLLYGESGTGKEVFAQSIHNDSSRSSGSFVAVNCAALPRDLIESEMFGYSPGSFTGADKAGRMGRFELASGGTLFLDEISEMPLDVQVKLLRVLQERQVTRIGSATSIPVDVRVIAAANRDLVELVADRAFREDLFYRLNVMRIDLPALRERREDIAQLADLSIHRICAIMHRPNVKLGPSAMRQLEHYDWPGNVRQLQNVMERLVNMTDADEIDEIPSEWLAHARGDENPIPSGAGSSQKLLSLEEAERMAIVAAIKACGSNLTKAAAVLGASRTTLYAKMRKYHLSLDGRTLRGHSGPN